MGKAGCWLISWGIESGNELILKNARKGADPKKAARALHWATQAGIKNWGYFIIGLPGETRRRRSARRSTSPRGCRWTWRCSTSPRPTPARPSSSR